MIKLTPKLRMKFVIIDVFYTFLSRSMMSTELWYLENSIAALPWTRIVNITDKTEK